jgi:hypothetical protein
VERLWSVDELYEEIARSDGAIIHYGDAQDGTPLIALRWEVQEAPRVLITALGDGANLYTPRLSFDLAKTWRERGWEVWLAPALDPARARLNESTLDLGQTAKEMIPKFRKAWAPGEDIESNLPVLDESIWQPSEDDDRADVPSRLESISLWRLLEHIEPDWIISLREYLTGGATVASSHVISDEDLEELQGQLSQSSMPLHQGGKIISGRQLAQMPGAIVLPEVSDEVSKMDLEERALAVGGLQVWQWAQRRPESHAWQLWMPRWIYSTDLASSEQSRDIELHGEQRERGGKLIPTQIARLNQPGHPAHGKEIRTSELKRSQHAQVGVKSGQPALSGWLAVEAWWERRDILEKVRGLIDDQRSHLSVAGFERASRLLRASISSEDILLKSYLQNKRYGKLATRAEWDHWQTVYRLQTVSILSEIRFIISYEDQRNLAIEQSLQQFASWIDEHYPQKDLSLINMEGHQEWLETWSSWAYNCWVSGSLAGSRDRARLEKLHNEIQETKRAVRDAKNLKLTREEQKSREKRLEGLYELQKTLQESIQSPETPEHVSGKDAQGDEQKVAGDENFEGLEELIVKEDTNLMVENDLQQEEDRPEDKNKDDQEAGDGKGDDQEAGAIAEGEEASGTAVEEGRTALNKELRTELKEAGMADILIKRFERRGVPVSLLEELEIPSWKRSSMAGTDTDTQTSELEGSDEDFDNQRSGEEETEDTLGDNASPHSQGSSQETASESVAYEGKIPMTEEIKSRLEEEGLPESIIERLTHEGIPDGLVKHLNISVAPAEETKPGPKNIVEEEKSSEEADLDILLPAQLILEPEWGRGPMRWDEQLPETVEKPFALLVERALAGDVEPQPATELEVSAEMEVPTTAAISAVVMPDDGFFRRRVELRSLTQSPPAPLIFPSPTGGRYRHRARSLNIS